MSLPSIVCFGSSAPISFATVGSTSMVMAGSSCTEPAGICPGQRATNGTRTPPSHTVPFPSRSGPALPPWLP